MLLIELVIVILFFSLSQVVLVQVFAESQRKTVNNGKLNQALLQMQSIAERLCNEPKPDTVLLEMGFWGQDGSYAYTSEQGVDLYANIKRLSAPTGEFVSIDLCAKQGEEDLFTLPTMRYFQAEVPDE